MKRVLVAAALAAFAMPAVGADEKFALDGENTKVQWVGKKADGKHDGGFKRVAGTATAAGADPTTLKIDVTIGTESLYSDDDKLTAHLKSGDFFDVKKYPKATFTSTKVEKAGDGYKVTGDLTLHGKKKSVSFPAKIAVSEDSLTLNADTQIDRTAFGMTYGQGKVDDKVDLKIAINAKRK
jgi:polyisoprenoid-binding protein YceI